MAVIAGPTIQMPASLSKVQENGGSVSQPWSAFFSSLQQTTFSVSRSGPTASRPLPKMDGRFIGMPYFDTTLGIAIWLASTDPDVWVRYDGTPV